MLKMIYSVFKIKPHSPKPSTFTAVPIGRFSGFSIFGKKPETLIPESSNYITTQAYGV